jgi:hypothetical protein
MAEHPSGGLFAATALPEPGKVACRRISHFAFRPPLRTLPVMKFLLVFAMLITTALADGPVRHVVNFKFKKDATPEQIERVIEAFAELTNKISVIDSFEWGTNSSPEGLDKGFTHCWIIGFRTERDRDYYLSHPDHTAFATLVKPLLADVQVVDFVPAKRMKKPKPLKPKSTIPSAWGAQKTG